MVKAREVDAGAVVNVDVLVRAVAAFFVTLCVINTAHVSLKMSGRLLLETGPDDGMVHTRYGKKSGTAPPFKSLSEYFNKCRRDDVFFGTYKRCSCPDFGPVRYLELCDAPLSHLADGPPPNYQDFVAVDCHHCVGSIVPAAP